MTIAFINTIAAIAMMENQNTVQTVQATDDQGGTVTYSITGGADAALFAADVNTGQISFVAAPDHDNPSDADSDNVYELEVTATSPNGSTAFPMSVTVTEDDSVLERNNDLTDQIATDIATAQDDIENLKVDKADKTAVNELSTTLTNLGNSFNSLINDAPGSETDKVFSKGAVTTLISDLQTALSQAITDKGVEVKNDLINGASDVLDTFKEVQEKFAANGDIIQSLQDVAAGRLAFDREQTLTAEQQSQVQANANVPSLPAFNTQKASVDAFMSAVGNPANYSPLSRYNAKKAEVAASL